MSKVTRKEDLEAQIAQLTDPLDGTLPHRVSIEGVDVSVQCPFLAKDPSRPCRTKTDPMICGLGELIAEYMGGEADG